MAAYGAGDQVAGQAGTWNLPNFPGELFFLSPRDTPLLSYIGGLTGGRSLASTQFTWQDTLHRAPADQVIAEGAAATFATQKRSERKNVVQIFHYGIEITYSKQSAIDLIGTSLAGSPTLVAGVTAAAWLGDQPIADEMGFQTTVKVEQAGLDVEWAFLNNTFANPNDGSARQTQGIIGHITTVANSAVGLVTVVTGAGMRNVVNKLVQDVYINGGKLTDPVLMVNPVEKRYVSQDFQQNNGNIAPRSETRFGVNAQVIITDFAEVAVVINRHLAAGTALLLDMAVLAPAFMPIRNKGHFFVEPIAKLGSYDRVQLYGEIGLQLGPEGWHGKATGIGT
jgi:hypothetical protein